ncbi:hypothetical protein GY45DRAFT_1372348 [Cubamyces sp. BRFM 1775]|nr:hypothetical protein GY45DRAFT_1372348 [Cubamyces sp. BRFM 1775]
MLAYGLRTLKPDGVVFSTDNLLLTEDRRETDFRPVLAQWQGSGAASVEALAARSLRRNTPTVHSSEQAQPVREMCFRPAFLIAMAGPVLVVGGAMFGDNLVAHRLAGINLVPKLGTQECSPLDDTVHRVARLFRALKRAIDELDRYCNVDFCLPYTHNKTVVLAKAEMSSGQATVVVKITYKYSKEAHELLANSSLALKLRYRAYEPGAQMYVVVMDYLEGSQGRSGTKLAQPSHIRSLHAAVQALNRQGFVFGDLHEPNVFTVGDTIKLIDFDWAGTEGEAEARYPRTICHDREKID